MGAPTDTTADIYENAAQAAMPEGQHEDEFGICPCSDLFSSTVGEAPKQDCFWCKGSGYRLVRRIIRPLPKPDFNEQAALAQLKTKDTHLRMAAATVRQAADMLHAAGKKQQSDGMHNAARAIEALVEGQD